MKKLENYKDLLQGDPSEQEKNLTALLPEAKARADQSIYLQILSEIALAQAMQKKFDQAHKTLDLAEAGLTPQCGLSRARVLLERGRTFQLAGNIEAALPHLKQAYELSEKGNLDLPVNVAYLIAHFTQKEAEKIQWYERAINIAKKSRQIPSQKDIGLFQKELAYTYMKAKLYKEAVEAFKQCLNFVEERMDVNQGDFITAREAKWGMGHALRLSGKLDEALALQLALLKEYENIIEKGDPSSDLPEEMLVELRFAGRGKVYEELAKIHIALAKKCAGLSYGDLSKTGWTVVIDPDRLEKMRVLSIHDDSND